ncbi:hypothetical protein BN13_1090023 [Nostocoides jenkinsii Ben 74]|uniref:Uncharacterized protein n=1 Tax=Nostocoides jenkinsii Ben 74 TaxID=1193518 RepID=A0A077MA37_9MICO|nr:hypothetical protein BN13_1090023 [Tetrasphaera jenkinsii Ben 74]
MRPLPAMDGRTVARLTTYEDRAGAGDTSGTSTASP